MDKNSSDLIGQRNQRLENLKKLRDLGIDPYPAVSKKEYEHAVVHDTFDELKGKTTTLAGRLMNIREHGKLIFGDLQDQSGNIQIALKEDILKKDLKNSLLGWDELKLIDIGDFIQVKGEIDKTSQGEITLFVKELVILTKSIRPLPNKLEDKEQQFRRRYIDLVVNTDRRSVFERKAAFWKANRNFMESQGFMEVETPVMEHVTGGADATPFTTHHNALDQDFYLRISTELYQKRLVGGGFEKIFTVGPNFRNEGLSDEHLQEFYQIEWYWAYANYQDNMKMLKKMLRDIALKVYGRTKFSSRNHEFDLADEWKEIDYATSIKKRFDVDIFEDSDEKMQEAIKKEGVKLTGAINRNRLIDNLWKVIRRDISGPAFLINEPAFMSPLAKAKTEDKRLTERFHILLAGSELGNGYSEINDPQYQLDQFLGQQNLREKGDDEAQMLDIDYVEMLEYGMPPTSGYAHSERLFWFLEGVTAREGTLFPQMRHEVDTSTELIYPQLSLGAKNKNEKRPLLESHEKETKGISKTKSQDFSKKMVLLLNREVQGWQLTNTVGHITAYLGAFIGKENLCSVPRFETKDGDSIPPNSQYPVISFSGKPGQMYNFLKKAEETGLPHLAYTQEMIEFNTDDELSADLKTKNKAELKYLGIGVFGDDKTIDTLTKKFSLYK